MNIWDFFTPEAGQKRRRWLEGQAGGLLEYVPPELRPWLAIAEEMNPVTSMERAGSASKRMVEPGLSGWDRMAAAGDMLSNVAGVVAPAVAARAAGVPVANAVEEVLTGYSPMVQPFLVDDYGGMKLYRGDTGSSERITGGIGEGLLFGTPYEDVARLYGDNISQFELPDGARVLTEGSKEFAQITGRKRGPLLRNLRPGENLTGAANDAIERARAAGYDAVEFNSMRDMGVAVINPSIVRSTPTDPATQRGFRAYHGSPHDFDRFDMSKIGTGEGAQAYGHGLYFADNEAVARGYRDALSPNRIAVDGRIVDSPVTQAAARFSPNPDDYIKALTVQRDRAVRNLEGAVSDPELGDLMGDLYRAEIAEIDAKIAELQPLSGGWFHTKPDGRMYEVQINADPNDFLDWDKPLSEQPQRVRDAFLSLGTPERLASVQGENAYRALSSNLGALDWPVGADAATRRQFYTQGAVNASERLREAGIPGIRYLDAGSRGAGDGSRNYVVFDDQLISIIRKYGIAGAAALYGVSAADVEAAMAQEQPRGLLSQ